MRPAASAAPAVRSPKRGSTDGLVSSLRSGSRRANLLPPSGRETIRAANDGRSTAMCHPETRPAGPAAVLTRSRGDLAAVPAAEPDDDVDENAAAEVDEQADIELKGRVLERRREPRMEDQEV